MALKFTLPAWEMEFEFQWKVNHGPDLNIGFFCSQTCPLENFPNFWVYKMRDIAKRHFWPLIEKLTFLF